MAGTIELVIVGLYMLMVLGIGYYFKDKRAGDDYWRAGGVIPTYVNTIAIFAAVASGGAFLGAIGVAYQLGAPLIWSLAAGATFGFIIGAVLIAKPMRSVDAYTITDIFDQIYKDNRINTAVPVIISLAFTLYVVAQLKAAGVTTEFLLDVDYSIAVVLAGMVFIAYVSLGGMWAITITDFIQGSMMWVMMVIIAAFSVLHLGGPLSAPIAESPRVAGMAGPLSIWTYIGFFLINLSIGPVFPHVIMRVFSSESPESAKRSLSWMAFIWSVYTTIAFFIIAAAAVSIEPGLANADLALIIVMENLLPAFVSGLVAAAILAAVMSTTDALLLSISASISNDIYGTVINPDASERTVVRLGTIAVVVAGAVGISIAALDPPDLLVQLLSDAIGWLASAMAFPMVLGIWWKRANRHGALAGILTGGILYPVLWTPLPLFTPILIALPASLIATVSISLLTNPPKTEALQRRINNFKHIGTGTEVPSDD